MLLIDYGTATKVQEELFEKIWHPQIKRNCRGGGQFQHEFPYSAHTCSTNNMPLLCSQPHAHILDILLGLSGRIMDKTKFMALIPPLSNAHEIIFDIFRRRKFNFFIQSHVEPFQELSNLTVPLCVLETRPGCLESTWKHFHSHFTDLVHVQQLNQIRHSSLRYWKHARSTHS